jgi:hypothetical protein
MDVTTIPVSGATQVYQPPVKTTTTTANTNQVPASYQPQPVQQTQVVANASNNNAGDPDAAADSLQAQYLQALQQAALSFKNSYPLGNQEFSIFKDATGQYITRYVSLIDGSITYVPQPVLVRHTTSAIPALISVTA